MKKKTEEYLGVEEKTVRKVVISLIRSNNDFDYSNYYT